MYGAMQHDIYPLELMIPPLTRELGSPFLSLPTVYLCNGLFVYMGCMGEVASCKICTEVLDTS